jgi:hypothetical protein
MLFAVALLGFWKENRDLAERNRDLAARLATSQKALKHANDLANALTAADALRVTLVMGGTKPSPRPKRSIHRAVEAWSFLRII